MRQLFAAALAGGCLLVASSAAGQVPAATVRADFLKTIDRARVPLDPSPAQASTVDGYAQELLSIASEPNERVPLLILKKPAQATRRAVVIALHGTGGSKEGMRDLLERYADQGFVAVAMDARHAGERATPIPGLANPYQSAILRAFRTGKGQPYMYDTVWDVMRLVDYLSARPDVDPFRIGVVGNSKGGTEAYLAAAADTRIAAAAPLIGVQSFGWSLTHAAAWEARTWTLRAAVEAAAADGREAVNAGFMKKFYDRVTPGLVDRFDGPAMLPLIAPRPLFVVNGDSDPRSALGGVRTAVVSGERAYTAAGARDRFSFLLQVDAAHEVTPEAHDAVLKWFVRWLSPSAS
ncbi:MAG: alpha/beta hydrolase [Acidobacteria bacterium]|nr:alpha/beta hydrolase [Acidobacteriota bacterium]